MNDSQIGKIRWRLPVVLMVSVIVAYFDRLNISLALPHIAREYGWTAQGEKLIRLYNGLTPRTDESEGD